MIPVIEQSNELAEDIPHWAATSFLHPIKTAFTTTTMIDASRLKATILLVILIPLLFQYEKRIVMRVLYQIHHKEYKHNQV